MTVASLLREITTSLRATAVMAHNMLRFFAIFSPLALIAVGRRDRSSMAAAASHNASRAPMSPCLVMRPV